MEKTNFKEFVPGQTAEFNAGFESFYIGREMVDNPYKVSSAQHEEWSKGFDAALYTAAYRNAFVVKSIQEARERLADVTPPALFKFPSLSLGADDLEQFNTFVVEARSKQVFLKYDEADFLQTKAGRLQSALKSLQTGRLVKKSE